MRIETRPFEAEHVEDSGRLLAARHRRHLLASPLLSERFADVDVATAEVAQAWKQAGASGAVALRGGRMVGYLLGAPKTSPVWGPNVWVESAGQAVEEGAGETVRDLYGAAAARWVEEGRTTHFVLVPAHDQGVVAGWFRVGFGHQQTHALRLPDPQPEAPPASLSIRAAERSDIPVLAELDVELPRHQLLSPCFAGGGAPSVEQAVADLEEDFDEIDTFVAEHEGRVVGSAAACDLAVSSTNGGLIRPDSAGFLAFAAVRPDARGLGAGRALGNAVLRWCADQGYPVAATDWRQTNLLSSRAWPALGFEDTFWRLHRTIGF